MSTGPFDPTDPFDAAADTFRKQVANMGINAMELSAYQQLDCEGRVVSFMAGVLTGLLGVCFAHVDQEGRDGIVQAVADYLPDARANAEGILDKPNEAQLQPHDEQK